MIFNKVVEFAFRGARKHGKGFTIHQSLKNKYLAKYVDDVKILGSNGIKALKHVKYISQVWRYFRKI